jgi:hypothetical protein
MKTGLLPRPTIEEGSGDKKYVEHPNDMKQTLFGIYNFGLAPVQRSA